MSVNHAALLMALTSWHSSDLRTQTECDTVGLPKGTPHTTFVRKETEFIKKLCAELSQAVRRRGSSISTAQGDSSLWRTQAMRGQRAPGGRDGRCWHPGTRSGPRRDHPLLVSPALRLTPARALPPCPRLGESRGLPSRSAGGCRTQPQVTPTPSAS